jgi:hypothetical protein
MIWPVDLVRCGERHSDVFGDLEFRQMNMVRAHD